jgi:hypothetical protein
MAKKLEEHLYRSAHLKDAYIDLASLKKRLHLIARGVGIPKSNTPSVVSVVSSIGTQHSVMVQTSAGNNAAFRSVVNLLQPLANSSQGPNLDAANSNLSEEIDQNKPLPLQPQKEDASQEQSQCEQKTGEDDGPTNHSEHDRLNKNFAQAATPATSGDASSTGKDDEENSEKKKVILHQQQRRLLLLRHASKCGEGVQCRVKFCPQMVTLWKHMKTCRDKTCKAAHCLSSRCVLNHYRICKSEGLTSTCAICAPVMKHIRLKEGDEGSAEPQDHDLLENLSRGVLSDALDPFDEMPADGEIQAEEQSKDSFMGMKDALESGEKNQSSDSKSACFLQPDGTILQTKQDLLNQVQQQTAKLTNQNQKLQQQLKDASTKLQLEQFQKQRNILQHLNQQFQQQQVVLESEIHHQRKGESGDITDGTSYQGQDNKLQKQEGKRTSESMDGESKDSRPNKVMKQDCSLSVPEGSATKKSSSLIESMQIADIEAHLDSLMSSGQFTPRSISRKCLPIVKRLREHENGWIFCEPVDPIELGLPDYYDVVEHPMDLDLVTKKLENLVYWDITSFRKDTRLVFENAIIYNGKDSDVGMMAKELLDVFEQDLSNSLKGTKSASASVFLTTSVRFMIANIIYLPLCNFEGLNFEKETKKADSCSLCGNHRRLYELPSLFCSGNCGSRNIRRNATYYTDRMKQNQWCESCYEKLPYDEPLQLDNGKETKKNNCNN